MSIRLLTIPISHYCEKARWALDRAGVGYREERHVQGIHQRMARRAGGKKTMPVLVTPERVLNDSADILVWADERMPAERRIFPDDPAERSEVETLCARFDGELGPKGRRLAYVLMLPERAQLLSFNNIGVPRWEDRFLRWTWPVAVRFINRELGIKPGIEVDDERDVWRELDYVGEQLADGRPYLCGDRFTAADLTFAALSAPAVAPPEYTIPLPQPDEAPPRIGELVERMREHPAGRHALRMFAEHR